MSQYRLVCIYDKQPDGLYRLCIEVCRDIGRMPPFIRNLDLDDVYKCSEDADQKELIYLIYQSGCRIVSPYIIENQRFLCDSNTVKVLRKNKFNYIRKSEHSTLKKVTSIPIKPNGSCMDPYNPEIQKELYIKDLNNWQRSIDVRFKIDSAFNRIPSGSSFSCCVVLEDNIVLQIDRERCIKQLEPSNIAGYNPNYSTIDLHRNSDPTETLLGMIEDGWNLFVPNQQGNKSRLFTHRTSSGIVWFSTEEDVNEDSISDRILECFLKSRNFIESDGQISLIICRDVDRVQEKDVASLTGATGNVLTLYDNTSINVVLPKKTIEQNVSATLRPYQVDGVNWLRLQRQKNAGCILADEMGLGKTIQVLAHLASLNNLDHHLVVAPVSLLYNWKNEIDRFTPQLSTRIMLVSYDRLRLNIRDFINENYDTIVIDEAQIIKNRETKKYKAISKLKCNHRIILTGTPIENSIEDIWSLFLLLNPSMISMYNGIRKKGVSMSSKENIALASRLLGPFILRRTKTEVLKDLPPKIESNIYIKLSPDEQQIYDKLLLAVKRALSKGLSGRISSIALEGLLRLRQACVSVNILPKLLRNGSYVESSKLNSVIDRILAIKNNGGKVIVFSQFVSALKEMECLLEKSQIRSVSLFGDTLHRDVVVNAFQSDPSIHVFLISLRAGGVGLNITAADTVILLDDWWNPAVEEQAIGRSHRIGQNKTVLVYRYVCKNTVEEKILELQNKKRDTVNIFNNVTDGLSIEEIRDIIE